MGKQLYVTAFTRNQPILKSSGVVKIYKSSTLGESAPQMGFNSCEDSLGSIDGFPPSTYDTSLRQDCIIAIELNSSHLRVSAEVPP